MVDDEPRNLRSNTWLYLAIALSGIVAIFVVRDRWPLLSGTPEPAPPAPVAVAPPRPASAVEAPPAPKTLRWLAFGGGAEPASNQVSIEQDIGLAQRVLGAEQGLLLFAGGPGLSPVQVLLDAPPRHDLQARLGELFEPRDGRDASYRPTSLRPHSDASVTSVRRELRRALREPGDPLLVFAAAHGEPGHEPRDNYMLLWGAERLTVADVASIAEGGVRPLRLVVTSCFSGGFAEMAFAQADPKRGAARGDHCGLFAATWDTEASGCDPNPDRRAQESYGLHFMRALARSDKTGMRLPLDELDLDGDRQLSLLEAHTRVRVASHSLSIPTTTSERWLRHAAPAAGELGEVALPEEQRVVDVLAGELGLADLAAARRRHDALVVNAKNADRALLKQDRDLELHWSALRIALLERWPVLDDPYHPAYHTTLKTDGAAIEEFLGQSNLARIYDEAHAALLRTRLSLDDVEMELAMVQRLIRAHETIAMARRLAGKGGPDWAHYQRLLACERSVIPL